MFKVLNSDPLFEVNEYGIIRRTDNGKTPKPWVDKDGYYRVYATKGGVKHYVAVHRAVAEAWIDHTKLHMIVNHLDSNPANNHYSNLEWTDYTGNQNHAFKFGRKKPTTGETHGMAILDELKVIEIRKARESGAMIKDIAHQYGVSKACISLICSHKSWKCVTTS